jgi:hypothetical protein
MGNSSSSKKRVEIFLSYGRRDASGFVDRLAKDLSDAGHRIWRDTAGLEASRSWDTQLAKAIDSSDLVVAVLTPHAVRAGEREESVCLDELAVARFHNPPTPIVPVMLIACEPPFVIYRLQWVDFQGADRDAARYHVALDQLLKAVDKAAAGVPPPHRSVEFEPLNFDLYLSAKTRAFVGREWLISHLFGELQRSGKKAILLIGEAGWGKTSFSGHLFAANPEGRLLGAHFCRADRIDTIDPRRFVQSITAMTALRVPAYADRLSGLLETRPQFRDETEMFERLFAQPLAQIDETDLGTVPRYLLIDGLDEAFSASGSSDLARLLVKVVGILPDWLRLIVTARDAFGIVDSFQSALVIKLNRDDPRNLTDVSLMIANHIRVVDRRENKEDAPDEDLATTLAQTISLKAEGNALVAFQLSAAVKSADLDADVIAALPQDLSALYRALMSRRIDPHGTEWAVARQVLEMVLATDAPLPISIAAAARGDQTEYPTRSAVNSISDLLTNQDDSIQVFHQTFRDFLNLRTTPFFVNRAMGARTLADFSISHLRAKLSSSSIVPFCRQQLLFWILASDNVRAYYDDLVTIYEQDVKERSFNAAIGAKYTSPADHELIRAYARVGMSANLLSVAKLVLNNARDAVEASGVRGWVNESRPKLTGEAGITMMKILFKFISLTGFSLEWLGVILESESRSAQEILSILEENAILPYVLGWLDVAGGWSTLGISRAFEDYGTVIYQEWYRLADNAKGASQMPLVSA